MIGVWMRANTQFKKKDRIIELREPRLKARFTDVYNRKFHLEFLQFCRQCQNHIAAVGVTGADHTIFAAKFLQRILAFRWVGIK